MKFTTLVTLLSSTVCVLAPPPRELPPQQPELLYTERWPLPSGQPWPWKMKGRPMKWDTFPLKFGLREKEETLSRYDVDDTDITNTTVVAVPNNVNASSVTVFQKKKWLNKDEIVELSEPSPEAISTVVHWLAVNGIGVSRINVSPTKTWVIADIPYSVAEVLLHTTWHTYKHRKTSRRLQGVSEWSIPMEVHRFVDVIEPTFLT